MVLPLIIGTGAVLWAPNKGLSTGGSDESTQGDQASIAAIEKERRWLRVSEKELEASCRSYGGSPDEIIFRLKDSLSDKALRSDFFLFLRVLCISMWLDGYEERGGFVHPEDQEGTWLKPLEWAEFPEFYDVAIQPRLSSDSLDLAFLLRLQDRYPLANPGQLFGASIFIYMQTYATLDTLAGRTICERYKASNPTKIDPGDPVYHDIRTQVNSELGLSSSFKELVDRYYGDSLTFFDSLVKDISG